MERVELEAVLAEFGEELVAHLVEALSTVPRPERLVDALAVAEHLGVERSWVYEHTEELGARRLDGLLRFSLAEVDRCMAPCQGDRTSGVASAPVVERDPGVRRRRRSGTGVPLLPVRGSSEAA